MNSQQDTRAMPDFALILADTLCGLVSEHDPKLKEFLICMYVNVSEGHVCFDSNSLDRIKSRSTFHPDEELTDLSMKDIDLLVDKYPQIFGRAGQFKPVIYYDTGQFYFHKYHFNERSLAEDIIQLSRSSAIQPDATSGDDELFYGKLFPGEIGEFQKSIAQQALKTRLTVISGGPGTGKTSVVIKIVAYIFMKLGRRPNCLLCAPTGKASARMRESITNGKKKLQGIIPDSVIEKIPENTQTVHRLIGINQYKGKTRYNQNRKLEADFIIIDECSMLDLFTATKLLDAIPSTANVIMVGDPNQLSSVEAGSVFQDICTSLESVSNDDSTLFFQLTKNFRFPSESPLMALSSAIISEDTDSTKEILLSSQKQHLKYHSNLNHESLYKFMNYYARQYAKEIGDININNSSAKLSSNIVLTPHRIGMYGSINMNKYIEKIVKLTRQEKSEARWYHGRIVTILKNSGEFSNGDMGICLMDEEKQLKVYFDRGGEMVGFQTFMIPAHEPAYALTIHKSQGAEYDNVRTIIPLEDSDLLCRELLYTAVTRARKTLEVFGDMAIILSMVRRPTLRQTRLRELITSGISN
mgnify:CR=1 FL=1